MKRLYRVRANFTDGGVSYTRTWHYQDKRAAHHRARVCREGRPGNDLELLEPLPAAQTVTVEESEPITWPVPTA